VAGNHELSLNGRSADEIRRRLGDTVHYLQDSSVTVDGVSVYGSPWTGQRLSPAWAFSLPYSRLNDRVWARIPSETQVLVTHCPPGDIMDGRIGCRHLRDTVLQRVRLVYCPPRRYVVRYCDSS